MDSVTPAAERLKEIEERGLGWLLDQYDGDLTVAAYRLAYLTNKAHGYAKPTPSSSDLHAAAKRIAYAAEITLVPIGVLAREARRIGLDVV